MGTLGVLVHLNADHIYWQRWGGVCIFASNKSASGKLPERSQTCVASTNPDGNYAFSIRFLPFPLKASLFSADLQPLDWGMAWHPFISTVWCMPKGPIFFQVLHTHPDWYCNGCYQLRDRRSTLPIWNYRNLDNQKITPSIPAIPILGKSMTMKSWLVVYLPLWKILISVPNHQPESIEIAVFTHAPCRSLQGWFLVAIAHVEPQGEWLVVRSPYLLAAKISTPWST